ncbi:MAG: hypothetical protein RIQ41_305 [Candidatus Parcubacteria bacterium]|jgi:hypothetical protein
MRDEFFGFILLIAAVLITAAVSYHRYRKLVPETKMLQSRLSIRVYPDGRIVHTINGEVVPLFMVPFISMDMAHLFGAELEEEFCDERGEVIPKTAALKQSCSEFEAALQKEQSEGRVPQGYVSPEVAALAPYAFRRLYYVQRSTRGYSAAM